MYPRRVKQTYDVIGPDTCDLLDKLLTCNPRERLTAAQALDHEYFWTDPLPADPSKLPTYEASHEFDKRGRRNQAPIGPPMQPSHLESRPLPAPTQPPPIYMSRQSHTNGLRDSRRNVHLMPTSHPSSWQAKPHYPPNSHRPPQVIHANNSLPPIPQTLPPLSLRPGQPLPMLFQPPPPVQMDRPPGFPPLPSHLPPRPDLPMGRDFRRDRREAQGELNYG